MPNGTIRNSAKAIIFKDRKVLFSKCKFPGNEMYCYLLPGGGQEKGETLREAVEREVFEETGARIAARDLALVREYIDPASAWGNIHQVEFYFCCELLSYVNPDEASNPDALQVGTEWIAVDDLNKYQIIPEKLKECFAADGSIISRTYIGKC